MLEFFNKKTDRQTDRQPDYIQIGKKDCKDCGAASGNFDIGLEAIKNKLKDDAIEKWEKQKDQKDSEESKQERSV